MSETSTESSSTPTSSTPTSSSTSSTSTSTSSTDASSTPSETPTEGTTTENNEDVPEAPEGVEKDVTFVIAQTTDERRNIPGTSQYLDEVDRRNAEIIRAKAESREPDLENPPATQGTPLYSEAQAKQAGLNLDGEQVQKVTLPVVESKLSEAEASGANYDANNGPGASLLVNSGEPRG